MKLRLFAVAILFAALPVLAQQAGGLQVFASNDADHASVLKVATIYDFDHADSEHYRGLSVELARFATTGGTHHDAQRVYYRFAGTGSEWKWNGNAGTDGHTALGSASIWKDGPRRQEYFIEREVVETRLGLERGLHSTFAGAAYDVPLSERSIITALAGVQEFTGGNVRVHLRARFIRVIDEQHGVSVQLRTRYFHSSEPGQFDYYSPLWYAEAIPVVQMRRFRGGWMFVAAGGWGERRDALSGWQSARLLEASVTSPEKGRAWWFKAGVIYTNTPVTSTSTYRYTQITAVAMRRF